MLAQGGEGSGVSISLATSESKVTARLLALQQLIGALAEARSYPQVATVIVDAALPALRAELGVVAVVSEDGQRLKNIAFKGVDGAPPAGWDEYPVTAPVPIAEAARTRGPVLVRTPEARHERYP